MRAVVQRVTHASVTVEGRVVGEIGPGLLILLCAMQGDAEAQADRLAVKIAKLRIFKDEAGKMNRSILDTGGAALVVSQFTLAADLRGNRPGFFQPQHLRTRDGASGFTSSRRWPRMASRLRRASSAPTWPSP